MMMTLGKQELEMTQWLLGLVTSSCNRFNLQPQNPKAALGQYGYFMTLTFSQSALRRIAARGALVPGDTSVQWDTVNSIYREVIECMFGNRYDQPKFWDRWPLLIAAIDFGGSRVKGIVTESERHSTTQNLHIHGVWLVHPDTKVDFDAYRARSHLECELMDFGPVDAIEIVPFDVTKPIDYGFKGHTKMQLIAGSHEDMRIYPSPDLNATELFYRWHYESGRASKWIRKMRKAMRIDRLENSEPY